MIFWGFLWFMECIKTSNALYGPAGVSRFMHTSALQVVLVLVKSEGDKPVKIQGDKPVKFQGDKPVKIQGDKPVKISRG